ncbi:MAG: hypothetical protein GWN99_06085 [Gemmatimonadetes bacterium]|nr:hypothetical protein [Gemmatimonadota bacterium]
MLGVVLALGTLLAAVGCPDREPGPISREEYIDAYVRILRAAEAAPDTAAASDSARRILAERGLTEDDLMEFAESYVEDPTELARIWEKIEERLKQPADTGAGSQQPGRR